MAGKPKNLLGSVIGSQRGIGSALNNAAWPQVSQVYSLDVYDEQFFAENQREGLLHAKWFIPLLKNTFHFTSLADVGCGTGHFLKPLIGQGMNQVLGIEGSPWAAENSLTPGKVMHWDLRKPSPSRVEPKFDLAISIEVAEHIEEDYADVFVETLCGLSNTVVLTAAIPGQGGEHHVNERPSEYWVYIFMDHGYLSDNVGQVKLLKGIEAARAEGEHAAGWWNNILVFRKAK